MNIVERSSITRGIPITAVGIMPLEGTAGRLWRVRLLTFVGDWRMDGETVALVTSLDAATDYVAEQYGITQQGLDGDIGFDRWWLA
jgi:hypothetical protein